eukprot:5441674-Amphidinium_carterae.1
MRSNAREFLCESANAANSGRLIVLVFDQCKPGSAFSRFAVCELGGESALWLASSHELNLHAHDLQNAVSSTEGGLVLCPSFCDQLSRQVLGILIANSV